MSQLAKCWADQHVVGNVAVIAHCKWAAHWAEHVVVYAAVIAHCDWAAHLPVNAAVIAHCPLAVHVAVVAHYKSPAHLAVVVQWPLAVHVAVIAHCFEAHSGTEQNCSTMVVSFEAAG